MKYNMEEIKALIVGYVEKHPLAEECGSDYIWQNDIAQVDAIQLVCDIFDNTMKDE